MKQIPNALCLLRAALGVALVPFALSGSWAVAFGLLAAAVLSDMLDGYLAKKLDAQSDFGRDVLEPNCDLVMVAGALAGLLLTGNLSWWPVVTLLALPAALAQWAIVRAGEESLPRKIANGFMPLQYVAAAVTLFVIYADKGLKDNAVWLLLLVPPVLLMVWEKRDRWYGAWLHGQAH